MGSLRSFGTWPHPNHQQPITEQETEKNREKENHAAKGPYSQQEVTKQKWQENLINDKQYYKTDAFTCEK